MRNGIEIRWIARGRGRRDGAGSRVTVRTYIDEERGLAIQEIEGDLTEEDILAAQRRLYVEFDHDPSRPCLWDATRGNVASAMSGGAMASAAHRSEDLWDHMKGGRTAILVAKESDFGMGRMYEQMASGMPRALRVFRDREEAIAWLLEKEET